MTTTPYPMRIPQEILTLSQLHAREEHLDVTTSLRKFLYQGAEEYALTLVGEGRLSIGKASELLGMSIYELHRTAEKHGIELGATKSQSEKSREHARQLLK